MDDFSIRRAEKVDLPEVVELWKGLMDFHGNLDPFFSRSDEGPENFRKWVEKQMESDDAELFVAVSGDDVLGYIKLEICSYPPVLNLDRYGMISDAAVSEAHRRGGIGEALHERAMEWFDEKGIGRIELRVANVNPVARGFWKKMGYQPYLTTMFREK